MRPWAHHEAMSPDTAILLQVVAGHIDALVLRMQEQGMGEQIEALCSGVRVGGASSGAYFSTALIMGPGSA